jgi:uncharacterized protein YbbK (DUF523 family)
MILISACLITRDPYGDDGKVDNPNYLPWLAAYADPRIFLPVCPAELAGLPRLQQVELRRIQRVDRRRGPELNQCQGMLIHESGERWPDAEDKESLPLKRLVLSRDISAAILTENSPTCGVRLVPDGEFKGKLRPGQGIATGILRSLNIPCYASADLKEEFLLQLMRRDLEYYYQA